MPASRVCPVPGCPTLTTTGRCTTHQRAADKARGTRQQRGYDNDYDRERRAWAPLVTTGRIACARCHSLITPNEPWHLDHTDDRTALLGPSHQACNTSAGGRAAHQ